VGVTKCSVVMLQQLCVWLKLPQDIKTFPLQRVLQFGGARGSVGGTYSRDVSRCNWTSSARDSTCWPCSCSYVLAVRHGPFRGSLPHSVFFESSGVQRGQHVGAMSSVTPVLESWVRIPLGAFMYRNPSNNNNTETQYQVLGVKI